MAETWQREGHFKSEHLFGCIQFTRNSILHQVNLAMCMELIE